MIVVAGFALVLAAVPLLDGRLGRLATIRFEKAWLVTVALAVQIPITTFASSWLPDAVNRLLHLGTYGLALGFVWYNRRHVGMMILVAGALCNLIAIAANAGVMPASESALRTAGFEIRTDGFENSGFVEDANVAFLGDVFAIPEGWPLANVFSIGDILLVLGGGWLVHRVCASRLFPRHRREVIVEEFMAKVDDEAQRYEEAARMKEMLEADLSPQIG